jgi:DNA-binding MarR family transcriptional regulator
MPFLNTHRGELPVMDTVFDTEEYNICLRIRHLDLLITRARRRELRALGVTPPQMGILHFAQQFEGPCTVLDLRRKMLRSNSSLMALLKRMEVKGLLRREADVRNHRFTRIILTEKGRRVYRRAMGLSVFNTIVAALPELDRRRLRDYIEVLITSTEKISGSPRT